MPKTVFLKGKLFILFLTVYLTRNNVVIIAVKFLFFLRWFPEVQNIFYQGSKRKYVPSHQDEAKLKSFFNSVATLMTEQLQNLCLHSIEDYTNLIAQPPVSACFALCLKTRHFEYDKQVRLFYSRAVFCFVRIPCIFTNIPALWCSSFSPTPS